MVSPSLIALLVGSIATARACTIVAVTKGASACGASLTAHTDDTGGGAVDLRLVRVPAAVHAPNTTRAVYGFRAGYPRIVTQSRGPMYFPQKDEPLSVPLGFIPEVARTYAYFDQDYGLMNEERLSIAESTCSAKTVGWPSNLPYGYNLLSIAELTKIALERCDSARCAVRTMGDLAVEFGFYSTDSGRPEQPGYDDSAEALAISDKYGETWVFHVLTGPHNASAVWAAQRVPDGHVTAVANFFTIRTLNLSDPDNYLASPNVESFAVEMGWWYPSDGPIDFTRAYAQAVTGPVVPLYGGRRIWRIFDTFAPSLHLDSTLGSLPELPTYPFSVAPDAPIKIDDVMELLKDHYEGTPYDMTKGLAAGPFGSPIRYDSASHGVGGGWERSISMHRTLFSFVHQVFAGRLECAVEAVLIGDDKAHGGVMWYGQGAPHGTLYVPFSAKQTTIPATYVAGTQSRFDAQSLWWVFSFVNNWSTLRFNAMNGRVRAVAATAQRDLLASQGTWPTELRSFEAWQDRVASDVLAQWWRLAWNLVSTYSDGYKTEGEDDGMMHSLGYPSWWLKATDYHEWPRDSFQPPTTMMAREVAAPWTTVLGCGTLGLVFGMALMWRLQTQRRMAYMRLD
ncbi:peptidase [Achlya hypogyna]|uniref:Peptidase n=1 Tax=Achlya hypogyna TaxID=1202772 RepID=A0A1V9ZE77_ACHHY|nr:peptidase [Achlya hypogyna]